MHKGLVSLLTPCYNMGHLIHRLFDSVLTQTYPYIEMFVIDDGSTDNSEQIIKSYIPRFEEKGYSLSYHYQDNSGLPAAIKTGLQLINGDYLAWPDSDDFYASPNSIAKMVDKLANATSEFAMVRTMQRFVDENTLEELYVVGQKAREEENFNLFEDCLFANNGFYFGAGAYMIRVSTLKEVTNFDIYTDKNAGQNWQLFLPILYSYKCLTIKEVLYNILLRKLSHGRGGYAGYEKLILRVNAYERTLLETLERIKTLPTEKLLYYKQQVEAKYCKERMNLAYDYKQNDEFIKEYNNLCIQNPTNLRAIDRLRYYAIKTKFDFLLRFFLRIYHKITK